MLNGNISLSWILRITQVLMHNILCSCLFVNMSYFRCKLLWTSKTRSQPTNRLQQLISQLVLYTVYCALELDNCSKYTLIFFLLLFSTLFCSYVLCIIIILGFLLLLHYMGGNYQDGKYAAVCCTFCQFSQWPAVKMSHHRAGKKDPADKYNNESLTIALLLFKVD